MTDNEMGGDMKGTGVLIVAAVCDEKGAVKVEQTRSMEAWLTNGDRFSAEWVSAVRDIFAKARGASC